MSIDQQTRVHGPWFAAGPGENVAFGAAMVEHFNRKPVLVYVWDTLDEQTTFEDFIDKLQTRFEAELGRAVCRGL